MYLLTHLTYFYNNGFWHISDFVFKLKSFYIQNFCHTSVSCFEHFAKWQPCKELVLKHFTTNNKVYTITFFTI